MPILAAGLFALAAILSIILLVKSSGLPGCGPQSACDAVTTSRWSRFGMVPVTILGAFLYAALATAWLLSSNSWIVSWLLCAGAALAIVSALWFTGLQLLAVGKVCFYCTLTHATASLAGILVLWNDARFVPILAGAGCGLLIIVLQIFIRPRQFKVIPAAEVSSQETDMPAARSMPGSVALLSGRLQLHPADWPLIGAPEARRVIAVLFDVTCTECRELYRNLLQFTRQNNSVAVLAIPVPMHPACNPTVCKTTKPNPDACDFARIYLALWQLDQSTFHQFETWLLGRSALPLLQEARSHINRSLGASRLTLALTNPALDAHLRACVDIYVSLKPDKLPQILLPQGIAQGKITQADLSKLIESISIPS